jgi:antirestriction protein ArdC
VGVVYADRFTPQTEKERASASGEEARQVPFLKRFTVFNVAQCEGLREDLFGDPSPLPEREIVPLAEAVIAASGVPFRIGGDRAFYVPSQDYVQVPPQPAFFEQINYYRTALHELCHSTGHASRLDRKILNPFGSKDYAREELVAKWVLPSSARLWASCRPCAMPTIWAHGWRCCARTIAPSSGPRARPARPPTGCSRAMPNTGQRRARNARPTAP